MKEQKGVSDAIENKNRIRRLIKHFFKDRDCQTLVRPIEDEKKLQRLQEVSEGELRPEFVEGLQNLRQKVLKKTRPKTLKGQIVTGSMLLDLANSYVDALNTGSVPTIESAWDSV